MKHDTPILVSAPEHTISKIKKHGIEKVLPVFISMGKRKDNLARVLKERLTQEDRHTAEDRKHLIEISTIIKESREAVIQAIMEKTCIKEQSLAEVVLTEIEEKVDALIGEEFECEDGNKVTISKIEDSYHVQKRDKDGKIVHQCLCHSYRWVNTAEIYSILIYDTAESYEHDWEYKIKRTKAE